MTLFAADRRRCTWLQPAARALLDLLYPELCVLCGAERGSAPWCKAGPAIAGLGWADGPHLCGACAGRLTPAPLSRPRAIDGLPVHAGRPTGPELVAALGQWKYHGVRGLAWPLTPLLRAAVHQAQAEAGPVGQLVPVALHARRRRQRGFNQAEVVARLAAHGTAEVPPVRADLLRRIRATGQQAKLESDEARRRNVSGAFAVARCPAPGEDRRLGLVDDLVTGGSTAAAAVAVLHDAGWRVVWVAALGLAAGGSAEADAAPDGTGRRVDSAPAEI